MSFLALLINSLLIAIVVSYSIIEAECCLGDSVTSCGADYKVGSSAGDLHPSSFSRDLTSTYPSFSISASSAPSLFPTSYSQNLQDCNARRAVEEVEKTRQRLPGTSVMSPSSCSHLRLLIARDASLIAASYGLREVHTHTNRPKLLGDSRQPMYLISKQTQSDPDSAMSKRFCPQFCASYFSIECL